MILKALLITFAVVCSVAVLGILFADIYTLIYAIKHKMTWTGSPIFPFLLLLGISVFLWALILQ